MVLIVDQFHLQCLLWSRVVVEQNCGDGRAELYQWDCSALNKSGSELDNHDIQWEQTSWGCHI